MLLNKNSNITKHDILAAQINHNLFNTPLPSGFELVTVGRHIFPDGYKVTAKQNERLVVLKQNNQGIGLLKYSVKQTQSYNVIKQKTKNSNPISSPSTIISLDFIQGIKQKTATTPLPKKWQETLMDAFINASAPILVKNQDINLRYDEFVPRMPKEDRNLERKNHIKKLEEEIVVLSKWGSSSTKHKTHLANRKKILEILQNKHRQINAIRDRYFDKLGYLNLGKERVQAIFKAHQKIKQIKKKQPPKIKPKTTNQKRIKKRKAIRIRRRVGK